MAAVWIERPERSNLLALRAIVWIALHLGRRIARLLLIPISLYFVCFAPRARRASLAYLRRVLGREPNFADRYRQMHCFAATILDRVFFLNGRADLFDIEVHGAAVVRDALSSGRGVFLFGAHLGSFEAMRAAGDREALRVAMVMYPDNARKINRVLSAINPEVTDSIIALGQLDSMLRVKRTLDDGAAVGMLCDRGLGDEPMQRVQLLGGQVALPVGPFKLAAMLGRPVILMFGLYRGGNRYELHFENLIERPAVLAVDSTTGSIADGIERYARRLEHYCRSAPYNWFNFHDLWDGDGEHSARG